MASSAGKKPHAAPGLGWLPCWCACSSLAASCSQDELHANAPSVPAQAPVSACTVQRAQPSPSPTCPAIWGQLDADNTSDAVLPGAGTILINASAGGLYPMPYAPIYAAAKAGCCNLVRSLQGPLAKRGIRIGAVCPEPVDTPLVSRPSGLGGAPVQRHPKGGKPGHSCVTCGPQTSVDRCLSAEDATVTYP